MTTRSLVIAMDGCDPAFLEGMIDAGELPNFSALRDRSSTIAIENDPAMGAAQFWQCVAVGGGPDNHGRYFYMQFQRDTYDVVPNTDSTLPPVTSFWETLDAEDYKVGVIDWHRMRMSKLKHGMLLHNWFGHDALSNTKAWPEKILDTIGDYQPKNSNNGSFANRDRQTVDELNEYIQNLMETIHEKTRFCVDQIKDSDWDLYIPTFAEIHDVGHYFYHIENGNHAKHDAGIAKHVKNPMRQVYRKVDWAVGELLKAIADDTAVSIVAGPGMETLISANNSLDEIVRKIDLGVSAPTPNAEKARATYKSLLPTKIRNRLAPLARYFRRNFLDSSYRNRRFFAIPHNDNSGAIRINLKGREKFGVVSPGEEYDAVVKEITDAFATFTNPDTGRPLVKRVVCIPHSYDGPHTDVLPDIFVEWDRTDTVDNFKQVTSERYGTFHVPPSLRTGDHSPYGCFWTTDQPATVINEHDVQRPGDLTPIILASVRKNPPIQRSP